MRTQKSQLWLKKTYHITYMYTHTHPHICERQGLRIASRATCGSREARCNGVLELTIVQGNNVQAVEQLSLVLVDPLHVHVKHGSRVDLYLVFLL